MESDAIQLNHEVLQNIKISSQEYMIIKNFELFYECEDNINLFCRIINSQAEISIRLIDHFVTKYAKHNKLTFKIYENNIEQIINIYTSYKQQLKIFQKKYFDPFSRGDRIPYFMKNNCVITTIGQLNFFKWFFSKNVFNYIMNNLDIIENDMNKKNKLDKKKDTKKKLKNTQYNNIMHKFTNKIYNNKIIGKTADNIIVSFSF